MLSKNRLKYFASFKQKKVREASGLFLVEGARNCEELFDSTYKTEAGFYCQAKLTSARGQELLRKWQAARIPTHELDLKSLNRLAGTVQSQGIMAMSRRREFDLKKLMQGKPNLLLALDQIHDPGNLGTIIRTANWFGVGGILLSNNSVEFTNPKVLRASMGSVFHIPVLDGLALVPTLIELQRGGYTLFAADADGNTEYSATSFPPSSVLLMGSEIAGVRFELKELVEDTLIIPKRGQGDSLNVAVASGILLSEMSKTIHDGQT